MEEATMSHSAETPATEEIAAAGISGTPEDTPKKPTRFSADAFRALSSRLKTSKSSNSTKSSNLSQSPNLNMPETGPAVSDVPAPASDITTPQTVIPDVIPDMVLEAPQQEQPEFPQNPPAPTEQQPVVFQAIESQADETIVSSQPVAELVPELAPQMAPEVVTPIQEQELPQIQQADDPHIEVVQGETQPITSIEQDIESTIQTDSQPVVQPDIEPQNGLINDSAATTQVPDLETLLAQAHAQPDTMPVEPGTAHVVPPQSVRAQPALTQPTANDMAAADAIPEFDIPEITIPTVDMPMSESFADAELNTQGIAQTQVDTQIDLAAPFSDQTNSADVSIMADAGLNDPSFTSTIASEPEAEADAQTEPQVTVAPLPQENRDELQAGSDQTKITAHGLSLAQMLANEPALSENAQLDLAATPAPENQNQEFQPCLETAPNGITQPELNSPGGALEKTDEPLPVVESGKQQTVAPDVNPTQQYDLQAVISQQNDADITTTQALQTPETPEKAAEKTGEQTAEYIAEKASEQTVEQFAEQYVEQAAEMVVDQISAKPDDAEPAPLEPETIPTPELEIAADEAVSTIEVEQAQSTPQGEAVAVNDVASTQDVSITQGVPAPHDETTSQGTPADMPANGVDPLLEAMRLMQEVGVGVPYEQANPAGSFVDANAPISRRDEQAEPLSDGADTSDEPLAKTEQPHNDEPEVAGPKTAKDENKNTSAPDSVIDAENGQTSQAVKAVEFEPEYELELEPDEKSGETARALLDMMSTSGGGAQPQERALVADTLLQLVPRMPERDLIALSERVGLMEDPPGLLVKKLINNRSAKVAQPLLEGGQLISDQDLLKLISRCDVDRLTMVAKRREISPGVCDALITRGEASVYLTLVRNPGANLSHDAFITLCDVAKHQQSLQAPLATRGDTPPPIAFELFWSLPVELRRYVLSRFLTDSATLDKILKIAQSVNGDEGVEASGNQHFPPRRKVDELVEQIIEGRIDDAVKSMAALAEIHPDNARRIVSDPDGEPLTVALKMLGISRAKFSKSIKLLSTTPAAPLSSERDLQELQAMFDGLSFNKARTLMKYWDWATEKSGPYARRAM